MKRIRQIIGHAAFARWLAEVTETGLEIDRSRIEPIRSPYHYSQTWTIMEWRGRHVIVAETQHARHEVFALDKFEMAFAAPATAEP